MATVGRCMWIEDQSNEWINARIVELEAKIPDAPARTRLPGGWGKGDLRKMVVMHREELDRRRDPRYVEWRDRQIREGWKLADSGVRLVTGEGMSNDRKER